MSGFYATRRGQVRHLLHVVAVALAMSTVAVITIGSLIR